MCIWVKETEEKSTNHLNCGDDGKGGMIEVNFSTLFHCLFVYMCVCVCVCGVCVCIM